MKLTFSALFLIFTIALTGCGSKRHVPKDAPVSNVTDGKGGVAAQFVWIKNKKKAIDVLVTLRNNYDFPVQYDPRSLQLTYNGVKGTLKKSHFYGRIAAGGSEEALAIFTFSPPVGPQGNVSLTLPTLQKEVDEGKKAVNLPALKLSTEIGQK